MNARSQPAMPASARISELPREQVFGRSWLMGLQLRISAGTDSVELPMGHAEIESLRQLRSRLPAEADVVFGVDDYGRPSEVTADAFHAAVTKLLTEAELSGEASGRVYYLQMEGAPGRWNTIYAMATVAINGMAYTFRVGKDTCTMEPKPRVVNGRRECGERVDMRDRNSIQTDHGEMRIGWRPIQDPLKPVLRKLLRFAEQHQGGAFEKVMG